MSRRDGIRWLSASRLSAYVACPRGHFDAPKRETPEMLIGSLRHRIIELALGSGMALLPEAIRDAAGEFSGRLDPQQIDRAAQAVRSTPDWVWPDPDTILSVEGADLPDEITQVLYGSRVVAVPITDTVGIRGRMDCLALRRDVLQVLDWKGQDPGDCEVQGTVYHLLADAVADALGIDYASVDFRGIGIPSGKVDRHAVDRSAIPAIRERVIGWIERYLEEEAEPGPHRRTPHSGCHWCPYWMDDARCDAHRQALTADPRALVPATVEGEASAVQRMADGDLIEIHEVIREQASLVNRIATEVRDELRDRISRAGELVHGGTEYYLQEQKTGGSDTWDVTMSLAMLRSLGVPDEDLWRFVVMAGKAIRELVDERKRALTGKGSRAAKAAIVESMDRCVTYGTHRVIRRRAVPITGQPQIEAGETREEDDHGVGSEQGA